MKTVTRRFQISTTLNAVTELCFISIFVFPHTKMILSGNSYASLEVCSLSVTWSSDLLTDLVETRAVVPLSWSTDGLKYKGKITLPNFINRESRSIYLFFKICCCFFPFSWVSGHLTNMSFVLPKLGYQVISAGIRHKIGFIS